MSLTDAVLPWAAFLGTAIAFLKTKPRHKTIRSLTDCTSSQNSLSQTQVEELRAKHFCRSVSVSYANSGPLMIVKGEGSRLIDANGRSYLDTRNNVAHCGHQHPHVVQSIQKQVAELNTNTRYLHPNATLLAKRLADLLPDPLDVVYFVNSGSEANDLSLRLARSYTGSKNTIVVAGGYHGHTLGVLEVSPYKYEKSQEFQNEKQTSNLITDESLLPVTPGRHVWKVPCPDTYRGPHRNNYTAGLDYAKYVQDACRVYTEERKEKVGAFIVEGGMSVAGVIMPPPDYLQQSVKAVRDAGGLYIADEVQTGFGRLGSCLWAFEYNNETGVVPDIVTVGKPFGNGMPLAAVITTREISDKFKSMKVEYFNTFGGNPVSTAAGLAVLDVLEQESLQEKAKNVGDYLKTKFSSLKERLDIIGDIRGSGLFLGIELVRDRNTLEPASEETSFVCTILKQKYSILTSIDGPHDNVLVVKPPMVFSKEDVDLFVDCFEKAVKDDLQTMAPGELLSMSSTPT